MLELIFLIVMLIFVIGLCFVITTMTIGFIQTRVPFIKSNAKELEVVLKKYGISSQDTLYELGSGDGYVAFHVERLTGAQVKGFELMLSAYLFARLKKRWKRAKADFVLGNFFKVSWEPATAIYCYLYPPLAPGLAQKMLADCKPGTLIFSRDFPLPELTLVECIEFKKPHCMFVYRI